MTSRPSVPRPRPRPERPERPPRPDDAAAAEKVTRRVPTARRDGVDAWTLEKARRTRAGVAANVMMRARRTVRVAGRCVARPTRARAVQREPQGYAGFTKVALTRALRERRARLPEGRAQRWLKLTGDARAVRRACRCGAREAMTIGCKPTNFVCKYVSKRASMLLVSFPRT